MSASPTDTELGQASGGPLPIFQQALSLWQDLPGLVSDRVELLALELQSAGRALALVLILGLAGTLLAMTAWGLLWALAVSLLMQFGLPLWGALCIALAVNAAAAALLAWRLIGLLPRLDLPTTRRHLSVNSSPLPATMPPPNGGRAPPSPGSGTPHDPQPAH